MRHLDFSNCRSLLAGDSDARQHSTSLRLQAGSYNFVTGMILLPALLALSIIGARAADAPQTLRLAGNAELSGIAARWSAGFTRIHPDVRIETHLTGSDTGMALLYTGKADIALLGRSPTPSEIQAFEWIFRYKPAQIEVLTGSLDRAGRSPAPVLFVHRDNPLAQLSLAQLDAIFGTEHRFLPADLRTWGQLGLTGEWADQPIHLYGPDAMSGTGRFFRQVVLNDSRMMNWSQCTEFADTATTVKPSHDAGRKAIAALARDRHGLAIASLDFANDQVRALSIAASEGGAPVAASRDNLINRRYPLTRVVTACINRKPDSAPSALVVEFLRYILSQGGQQAVTPDEGYLPLDAARANLEAHKLD